MVSRSRVGTSAAGPPNRAGCRGHRTAVSFPATSDTPAFETGGVRLMSDDDVDPIDEINFSLWGDVDDETGRAKKRVEGEGPDGPAAGRVAAHQHLRDVLGRIEASRTPPELKAWLMRTVAERRPEPRDVDVAWI